MKRGRLLLLIVLALAVAGGAAAALGSWPASWRAVFGPPAGPPAVTVSGNIEAHESVLSFTDVQAPIVFLPFDEGARVAAGTVLARVDDRIYQRQVDIDRASLTATHAQLSVSQALLAAARQNVDSDQYDLAEKKLDYTRAETLLQAHTGTQQVRDLAFTAEAQSAANLAHDQAMVTVAERTLTLQQANVATAAQKLRQDEVTLSYATLRAPFSGVIAVREAELGELAGPGVAIFTLDDLDHVWLRAYVNEPDHRQGAARRGRRRHHRHLPGKEISRPHRLHLGRRRVHAEDRRDARGARDARLSHPHRHRQPDARAFARHAGRRDHSPAPIGGVRPCRRPRQSQSAASPAASARSLRSTA